MKLVTFNGDMAPHGAGDTRLVPDDVARTLEREKKISASEDWPPAPAAQKPERPMLKPARPTGRHDQRIAK